MTKWHEHAAHMAKHMNMVGGPLWWGPCPPKSSPDVTPYSEKLSSIFSEKLSSLWYRTMAVFALRLQQMVPS